MQSIPHIPGYECLQALGGGQMTCVWSARELETDTPCAVKVLRRGWETDPTAIKLLQREARTGLKVRHPHVVPFRRAHVTRPPYFLVMELLAGESLRSRLRREYRLTPATALWIARQTAEALAALHRLGFIHGDVKPDNIRLVDAGTAVLIDLGFAHRPGENAALLEEGCLLGTVNYLPPEMCGEAPTADTSADLYSLGVTLFEMLTGTLPYPRGDIETTLRRHRDEPPADLRRHCPVVVPGLAPLVERLLARTPTDRPRAGALVQQLIGLEISEMARRRAA
jgi:serine/threonine protein kinase